MTQILPGWSQPDNFRKAPHQRLVDKANETAGVTPPDGQDFHRTPKGSGLVKVGETNVPREPILVSVDAAATRGGVYTGHLWEPPEAAGDIDPDAGDPPGKDDIGEATDEVVIVNRQELGDDTHVLINDDEEVLYPTVWEAVYLLTNADGREVYTIDAPAPGTAASVQVKIESVIGGGKYAGHVYDVGTVTDAGTGDFVPPDALAEGASCLIVNQDEQNTDQSRAALGTYAVGTFIGLSTEATPRPVIMIPRPQYQPGVLVDYADTNLDSGSDQFAAAAETWGTGVLAVGASVTYYAVPFTMQVITREEIIAGPQIRYTKRVLAFDADGRLAGVGEGNVTTVSV